MLATKFFTPIQNSRQYIIIIIIIIIIVIVIEVECGGMGWVWTGSSWLRIGTGGGHL